jgi:hypothetical protein
MRKGNWAGECENRISVLWLQIGMQSRFPLERRLLGIVAVLQKPPMQAL